VKAAGCFRRDGEDVILLVKTQPKASQDEFAGTRDDRLRVRITAAPVDGRANAHLVAWLAKQFGVARRDVVIEQGMANRHKRIRIKSPGMIPEPVRCAADPV
jgi:uncharacterized protein (TIGR00251 family)